MTLPPDTVACDSASSQSHTHTSHKRNLTTTTRSEHYLCYQLSGRETGQRGRKEEKHNRSKGRSNRGINGGKGKEA